MLNQQNMFKDQIEKLLKEQTEASNQREAKMKGAEKAKLEMELHLT